MKFYKTFLVTLLITILYSLSCTKSDDVIPGNDPCNNTLEIINPDTMIPLQTTVSIVQSGKYLIPSGTTLITTRCCGGVTVAYQLPDGSFHSNTCQSNTGNSNQTNIITGVSQLEINLTLDAHAEVILK